MMTDHNDLLGTSENRSFRLAADGLLLMLKGAGYAMAFCLAVWFSIWIIAAVGRLLPEESRETEDPTPFSMVLPASGQLTS